MPGLQSNPMPSDHHCGMMRRHPPRGWIGVSAVMLVVAASLWVYTSFTWVIWDGHFELSVHVSSTKEPLRSVRCQAFSNPAVAEMCEQFPSDRTELYSATSARFSGEPLQVTVPVVGRESMSGRALSRNQFECLEVVGTFHDGQSIRKLVEIPDGRVSREVSVSLP